MEDVTKETKRLNSVQIILYMILTLSLGVSVYFNLVQKSGVTFSSLPQNVQTLYVKRSLHTQLENSYAQLESNFTMAQNSMSQTQDLIEDEAIPQTSVGPEDTVAVKSKVSKVKDFTHCYEMDNASYKVSKKCRKNIITYVEKHHDAKYFEIIGVVDNLEFNLFNNLQNNKSLYKKLGVNQKVIDKMKKLTRRGLSKERASEASWVIKSFTKQKAATYNANYEIVSKKGQRGVIIRAYK